MVLKFTLWKGQTVHAQKNLHSEHEKGIINVEAEKHLHKGVIIKYEREDNDFAAAVFNRETRDLGTY